MPIDSITNGIHIRSWISKEMGELFDRYLGPPWREDPVDRKVWELVDQIPDDELWRTHERRRERLERVDPMRIDREAGSLQRKARLPGSLQCS